MGSLGPLRDDSQLLGRVQPARSEDNAQVAVQVELALLCLGRWTAELKVDGVAKSSLRVVASACLDSVALLPQEGLGARSERGEVERDEEKLDRCRVGVLDDQLHLPASWDLVAWEAWEGGCRRGRRVERGDRGRLEEGEVVGVELDGANVGRRALRPLATRVVERSEWDVV